MNLLKNKDGKYSLITIMDYTLLISLIICALITLWSMLCVLYEMMFS